MPTARPVTSLQPDEKLALLNEIGRMALTATDVDELFRASAGLLKRRLDLQYVMVGTFDFADRSIITRATAGLTAELALRHVRQYLDDGIIGEVSRTGRTVVVNDVTQDARYLESIPDTRSEMCIPLMVSGAPIGFLNIESSRIGAFERADVELLETVGSFLGQAIRNADLRAELQESRNYLESLVQNAGDAILTLDPGGRIRTWNHAAEALLGTAPADLTLSDMLNSVEHPREPLETLYGRVLGGDVVQGVRIGITPRPGGEPRTLELSMAPVRDGKGGAHGMSCILRDVTEKIRNEQRLQRNLAAMQLLNEVGKEMTAILELDDLLNRIAVLMRRVVEYEILGIFLHRPGDMLELRVAIGYAEETIEKWRRIPVGTALLGHAVRDRVTIVSQDMQADPRAVSALTADGHWTRSEVAVPLISRDRLLGGLIVESSSPDYFSPGYVQILETLASQIAVSIENAQLFEEVRAKEKKLEMDFALARDLQSSMLPVEIRDPDGFEIAAAYKPAESLGGDYYDLVWLEDNRLGIAVGDVSGKGVAAAMTMAATRSALRFAARIITSPSQVLYHVNRRLHRDVKNRTYVSLFYGVLDVGTRQFRWSNGGHFPPLVLRRDGSVLELSKGGTLIALFDKSRYASGRTRLAPGDVACFYTDGIIEARNATDEEFGKERLVDVLRRKSRQSAKDIVRAITGELKKFTRGADQHDDITAVILRVREDA
jgi:PAS domain S-box-containing protein